MQNQGAISSRQKVSGPPPGKQYLESACVVLKQEKPFAASPPEFDATESTASSTTSNGSAGTSANTSSGLGGGGLSSAIIIKK